MKIMRSFLFGPLLLAVLNAAGCAEWQTTPVTVISHRGLAVNRMTENQTMYPEHSLQNQQVEEVDGQKAEGVMRAYRLPAVDPAAGKERVIINLPRGGGSGN